MGRLSIGVHTVSNANKKTIWVASPIRALTEGRPPEQGLSNRLAQVAYRYLSIMQHHDPHKRFEPECLPLLREVISGGVYDDIHTIRRVWMAVEDAIKHDGAAERFSLTPEQCEGLVCQLKVFGNEGDADLATLVALVEWAEQP